MITKEVKDNLFEMFDKACVDLRTAKDRGDSEMARLAAVKAETFKACLAELEKPEANLDKAQILAEIGRAHGVICSLYAMVRDCVIGARLDESDPCKLNDVVADTLAGLNSVVDMIK